ncbi:hypothetical protein HD554DRAFT_2017859, partial [Boletus coccyginus]
ELAKEGIPFDNRFWMSGWPTGKGSPPGLVLDSIPSVIVILGLPMDVTYPFILDVQGYPGQIINLLVVVGLFRMHWKRPNIPKSFKVWWPLAMFYLVTIVFLVVAPFLPPANARVGDTPPIPCYLYCIVGKGVMFFRVAYRAMWRILLPKVFRYELVPRKETLKDGTVVTLVYPWTKRSHSALID